MQGKDHNLILGIGFLIEFIIYGLFGLLFVALYGLNIAVAVTNSPDTESLAFVFGVFLLVLAVCSVIALPLGIASWKLLKNKKNARIWGIIAAIISLPLMIPVGTVIGVYGLWFCISDTGRTYYEGISA